MGDKIKNSNENTLLFLIQLIHTELDKYVTKVSGKGLSTEDFTSALKTKLEGINLSLYSTTEQMNTAIADAVKDITGIKFDGPYTSLDDLKSKVPTGAVGTIYLVTNGGLEPDTKDEYYWDSKSSKYEFLGTTKIDLSGYLQKSDLESITQAEVKTIWDSVFTS